MIKIMANGESTEQVFPFYSSLGTNISHAKIEENVKIHHLNGIINGTSIISY